MNQEDNALRVTTNLKISSGIDDKYLQDEHSLDEHFEVNGKIFNESNFVCINCGPQVSVLRKKNGSRYSFWSANQSTRDTITKITCLVEVNLGSTVPLLAAGTEEGLLCFYYTGVSRVLRAVQFSHKIVSLVLLDNGEHSEIGNWVCLPEELQLMNGVLAVGLDGGAVYLVDICRHLLEKSIIEGGPVYIEFPSQLLLINLRTDTSNDIKAKKEHTNTHPGETLALFLNENTLDQFRKVISSNLSSPIQKRNGDYSIEEFHLVVTALEYFKEIACLAVGFNSGCFQLWQLSLFRIIYVSPLMDSQVMPVAGFSFQEPTDDPHCVCFIWAAHQSNSNNACRPFAAMYMVSFATKRHIDDYGCFYENYKGCQPRYELALGEDIDSVIDGRIISCHSISKMIKRRWPQWSIHSSNEDESIVSVCAIAWEVWTPERTNVISKLTLFDINQWYRAQMPCSLDAGGGSSYVTNILLPDCSESQNEPLLDVCIHPDSLTQFFAYQPLDEHYFPISLSFACTCLYEHQKLECVWKGIQNELINSLDNAGPSALLDPSRYFNRFLSVGLKPSFYESSDVASLSVVTERQMLLTVMLEQGHMSFIKECVRLWADGCLAVANCTLPTLIRWGWSAVTFYKQMADNICIQLFDHRNTPTMKELAYVVLLLHKLSDIFDYILKNYRNFILEGNVELQSLSLQLFIEFLDSVIWSAEHKILPEVNELPSKLSEVIPYPQMTLQNKIIERREKMHKLSRKLLDVSPQLCLRDLLLVDVLLKETPGGKRIISQWETEGSMVGGLYPPPSIQSILRIFLFRGVPSHFKHMLIYYFLLDVADLLQENNPYAAKMLQDFSMKFRLSKSQILITKALWLIDNGNLKEAIDHLTHDEVNQNDISESNHKVVMYSLYVQGESQLALAYFRAFHPLLSELEDAKFHLLILLECGHILQAFDFQRKYRHWQTELLDVFFCGCMRRKELGVVYKLSLDSSEEEAFTQFLEANRHPHSEDLRVLYLLSRARYVEAIDINKKLSIKRAQGTAPPAFERTTPLKGLAFKKNAQKPKEEEARDQIRDVIVSAFAKTLPPITKELADFCSRQKTTLGTWKKVDRPDPLSVAVNKQPQQAGLKERFVELALAKTRQTWAPLLATPHALKSRLRSTVEETPFLRSTPFSFRTKATTPRNSELNQSLLSATKHSVKRGLGSDEADESAILRSEAKSKRARFESDEISAEKKKNSEAEGALLLSTPFVKRQRSVAASEVTPRTPLSILKSPWKSGQSSLSRNSDTPAWSSPMPRQIRFCEDLETESVAFFERRSTPARGVGTLKECVDEMSETDEEISMTSPPDTPDVESEQSFIKVTFADDGEKTQTEIVAENINTTKTVGFLEPAVEKDVQSCSQGEEESSVIDIASSDSKVDNSSPDRIPSSPSYVLNLDDDKARYNDAEEVEEQKTYQNLSTASVFVNVSGELQNSVYELEEGEIDAECGAVGMDEESFMAKEIVFKSDLDQEANEEEKEQEAGTEEDNKIDIYAGIDDYNDNFEPRYDGDDEFYKGSDDFVQNYGPDEFNTDLQENEGVNVIEEEYNQRKEEKVEEKEEGGEEEEEEEDDDDDEDQVICLDDSSNSVQGSQEEPVTVIPKRNRFSSEEELDYDESRMYGDYGEEERFGEEGEDENELEEEEVENEEVEEEMADEEEIADEEEEEEEEEEDDDDDDDECDDNMSTENYVVDFEDISKEEQKIEVEGDNDEENNMSDNILSNKTIDKINTPSRLDKVNSLNKLENSEQFINPFCKKEELQSKSDGDDIKSDLEIATSVTNEEEVIESKEEERNEKEEKNVEETNEHGNRFDIVLEKDVCKVDEVSLESEMKLPENSANDCKESVEVSSNLHKKQGASDINQESHEESFGKLELSFEDDAESAVNSVTHEQEQGLSKSTIYDENVSSLGESKLHTIEEESEQNQTECSAKITVETTNKISEAAESSVTSGDATQETQSEAENLVSSESQSKDLEESYFASPLKSRSNRRSVSDVPSTRDLKLRRSMRKSSSTNRLSSTADLVSATDDLKNISSDMFENSPTMRFDNKNMRSRRSSSVVQSPSRKSIRKSSSALDAPKILTPQSKSISSSLDGSGKDCVDEELNKASKIAHNLSFKEQSGTSETASCIEESMDVEQSETLDSTKKSSMDFSLLKLPDSGSLSNEKTITSEMEVNDKEKENSIEISESIVVESVVAPKDEKLSVEKVEIVDADKMDGQVNTTTTTIMDASSSAEKELKRPFSCTEASEAPESVYNENEEPMVSKPLQRRAASVSKLDEETGKLSRIKRSSRRYRSGMVWSEYLKNVDSYSKLVPDSSCASSVSSALDCADDVSIVSMRESISTATSATGTSRKLRLSRYMDRSCFKTNKKSCDILLSDEEDETTKSAILKKNDTLSSSVVSVVGSIQTVPEADETSPVKRDNSILEPEVESPLKEDSCIHNATIKESEKEIEAEEEATDSKKVKGKKKLSESDVSVSSKAETKRSNKSKSKRSTQSNTNDSDNSSSNMLLTDLKKKELSRKKDSVIDSEVIENSPERLDKEEPISEVRKSQSSKTNIKRSRSISTLSSKTTSDDVEQSSSRNRLRRGRTRSESPVGLSKAVKRSQAVGDLFGDDSPDTTLTRSLRSALKRNLRKSKLLDRPPSRSVLDVIVSEDEEEDDSKEEVKTEEKNVDGKKKEKKMEKKRKRKDVGSSGDEQNVDEDVGVNTPTKRETRGKAKSVVASDVETTPIRNRKTRLVLEDSDVSVSAASDSKPRRGKKSVKLEESTSKRRTPLRMSSPESLASNASATVASKKKKKPSPTMLASSTPEKKSTPDLSMIDSSIIDYTTTRRLTRHQLANMQRFPIRKREMDESILDEANDSEEAEDSVCESSVSSVMSTRSSARLRMKAMKKL